MNRPDDPSGDEPIEPRTRQTLWRLRARLVTPSEESRVDADLDAILAAAETHAHDLPDVDASPRPGAQPLITAPAASPLAAVDAADDDGASDHVVVALARPRRRLVAVHQVGRAAAVAVFVAAVGGGAAIARDGEVSLRALLGRAQIADQPEQDVAAPMVPQPVETQADAADGPRSPEAPTQVDPIPDSDPLDGRAGALVPDADVPTASDSDGEPDDAPDGTERSDTGSDGTNGASSAPGRSDQGSSGSGGTSSGGTDPSGSSGSSEPQPDPDPEPEPDTTEEQVIAAPAPDDLSGAGGPQPCDAERVRDCLPHDDGGAGPDPDDPAEDDQRAREELAARRAPAPPPEDED